MYDEKAYRAVINVVPRFLNRMPGIYKKQKSFWKILAQCLNELEGYSGINDITDVQIKICGIEQSVYEYVKGQLEERYNVLAGKN
jgi:hypothetical protein